MKDTKSEDEKPQESYPYMWSPASETSITEFTAKVRVFTGRLDAP